MIRHESRRTLVVRYQVLMGALLWAACACLAPARTEAATALKSLRLSSDVSIDLGGILVDDEHIVLLDSQGGVALVNIGSIPAQADLDAYYLLPDGLQILSFDTTVVLPGSVMAEPGDVVGFDGAVYSILFDASSAGLPAGVNVDAVSVFGAQLLLSFDISADLNGLPVEDEDLVLYEGGAAFTMFLDGSAAGVGPDLDLVAAQYLECNGHLLLSFDGSGAIGSLFFDDEDLLEYDGAGTWEMAYDGSAQFAWGGAAVDTVYAAVDPGPGPPLVFGQVILADASSAADFVWPNPVAWKGVRGAMSAPSDVGAYQVNATFSAFGTELLDPSVPPMGTGYWYMVKPAACVLTSWQTTLGAEPGRDAAIP